MPTGTDDKPRANAPSKDQHAPENRPKRAAKRSGGDATSREDRLAEALRANLRRRKAGADKNKES